MNVEQMLAKITTYFNAAEFIRSHGEEGGQFQEDYPDFDLEIYFKECEKLAKILDKRAMKFREFLNKEVKDGI